MAIDINTLISENAKSIQATDNCISRLGTLRRESLDLSDEIRAHGQLSRATADKIHLQLVRAHLQAANVVVAEMNQETLERLDVLAARIDRAILSDFRLNATITMIQTALTAVEEIASISQEHTT